VKRKNNDFFSSEASAGNTGFNTPQFAYVPSVREANGSRACPGVEYPLFLFLVVIGSLIFYLFLYVFTPNADYIASGLVDQRNLLTIIPLTIFYIGLLFSNQSVKINL